MAVDEFEEEDIAEVQQADTIENALDPNGLLPNGLLPNGLLPNGLLPNGLVPASLPANIMASLQDDGEAGRLSRLFMKYAVSCAFNPGNSFTVSWTDSTLGARSETYWGSIGLAPEWQTGPLSTQGQKWVTACVGARANFYSVSVIISMRNTAVSPALTADSNERSGYNTQEGAFWGNVFAPTPQIYSCYNPAGISRSRAKQRVCASGYDNSGTPSFCANVQSVGSCDTVCTFDSQDPEKGYTSCGGSTDVITTYLN